MSYHDQRKFHASFSILYLNSRNVEGESTDGKLWDARCITIVLIGHCVVAVTDPNAESLATNVVPEMPNQNVTADKHRSNSLTILSNIISSSFAFPRSSA